MKASIRIFDEITEKTLDSVTNTCENLNEGDEVELLISSYGGEILYAISIIDILERFKTTAKVIGFACSSAAVIAISCDRVVMSPNSCMLLHSVMNPFGDRRDPAIDKLNGIVLSIIQKRCATFEKSMLNDERWYYAGECLELGLADEVATEINKEESIEYHATINRFVAKLSRLTNIKKEDEMAQTEEQTNGKTEEQTNGKTEKQTNGKTEKQTNGKTDENLDDDEYLIKVLEQLVESVNSLSSRFDNLESRKENAETGETSEKDPADNSENQTQKTLKGLLQRITNNVRAPQGSVSIGGKKQKETNKVNYKEFSSFIKS